MTARPEDLIRTGGSGMRRHYHEPVDFEDPQGRYGLLAEFADEEDLIGAVRAARAAGYTRIDAFSPYPVEGLAELVAPPVNVRKARDRAELISALRRRDVRGVADWLGRFNLVALITLLAGITGGIVGYGLQLWSMARWYPYLNVAGRPYNSWPYYLPITYELVILFAALAAIIAMILLNGFPRPYHPVFNVPEFAAHATQDRFFLLIQAADPRFVEDSLAGQAEETPLVTPAEGSPVEGTARDSTRQFLASLAPGRVYEAQL